MNCPAEHCRSEETVFLRRVYSNGEEYALYYCRKHKGKFAVPSEKTGSRKASDITKEFKKRT